MWKVVEFRNFLLHTGSVVLKHVLKKDIYNHFIILHVEEEKEEEEEERTVIVWDEEAIKKFKKETEEGELEAGRQKEEIEVRWNKLKERILAAMTRKRIKIRKKELGHKDWWDRSCTRKKREVKKAYWRWRRGRMEREKYIKKRKEMRELQEEKQWEKRRMEEEELRKLRKEADVWKYINKKRIRKEREGNKIGKQEWKKYFMDLLEGEEASKEMIPEKSEEEGSIEEDKLEEEEIGKAIRRIKGKKAPGVDGISIEAWRHAGEAVKRELKEIMKQVWKTGEMPDDWKRSIIVPIYKRGDKEVMGNYRGISLLCTAYKIYAEIIRDRLEEEAELKRLLPESQAGFSKRCQNVESCGI